MNLRAHFLGRPIILRSPLRRSEIIERINEASKSRWWMFRVDEVVGGVRFGRVDLRYASSPF